MSTTVPLMKLSAENQKHTIAGSQHAVEVRERLGRILDTTSFERRKKSWLDRELMRDASTPRYHTRTKGTFLSCTILETDPILQHIYLDDASREGIPSMDMDKDDEISIKDVICYLFELKTIIPRIFGSATRSAKFFLNTSM